MNYSSRCLCIVLCGAQGEYLWTKTESVNNWRTRTIALLWILLPDNSLLSQLRSGLWERVGVSTLPVHLTSILKGPLYASAPTSTCTTHITILLSNLQRIYQLFFYQRAKPPALRVSVIHCFRWQSRTYCFVCSWYHFEKHCTLLPLIITQTIFLSSHWQQVTGVRGSCSWWFYTQTKETEKSKQPVDPWPKSLQATRSVVSVSPPPAANCKTNGCFCTPAFLLWLWGMQRNTGHSPLDLYKTSIGAPRSAGSDLTEQKSSQGHQSNNKTFETVAMFYGHWWTGR